MTVVSAFFVPGNPLPDLCSNIPEWHKFRVAMQKAGEALRASKPDAVVLYSTQWYAVLDEIWLTRRHNQGVHVDQNWHEYGGMFYDFYSDVDLANSCIEECKKSGIDARGADYPNFPIDSGTIMATSAMGIGSESLPVVVASNNLYDNDEATERLGQIAAKCADLQGKRVAVVGVGGLSGGIFNTVISPSDDRIVKPEEDAWNKRILSLFESGSYDEIRGLLPSYVKEARVDMGFKHFNWVMGAIGGKFSSAKVHEYGPIYGGGAAVIEICL